MRRPPRAFGPSSPCERGSHQGSSLAGGLPPPNTRREGCRMTVQGQSRLHHSPPKPAARSRLIIGDCGPSDSALAAARGWRLRRPAADRHAARCASRDLCSGGAPRRYPPSIEKALNVLFQLTDLLDQSTERRGWSFLSESSLQRVWDNDEDAVYDNWKDL